MTYRWTRTAAAIALITACSVTNAAAQRNAPAARTTGDWSVTPFIGFGFSGDLDSPTGVVGAAGGYNWSPKISLEGEFNVLPSSENGGLIEVDSTAWSLTGNILYHFAPKPFTPYGAFGIGYGHSSVDASSSITTVSNGSISSNEFVVNFGGGAERSITDNIKFRGDLRYFFGGDLVPDYWRLSTGLTFAVRSR